MAEPERTGPSRDGASPAGASAPDGLPQSPLYAQYRHLRSQAPGSLLLFRLGDFYELFGEDAKYAAPRLGLMLTSRDGETPMCGVPAVALEETLQRLVSTGRRIAVAEQMEAPRPGVKLVRREIVRMASAGTYVEPEGGRPSDPEEGHHAPDVLRRVVAVASVPASVPRVGVAVCDVVTGALAAVDYEGRHALQRALRTVRSLGAPEVLWDPGLGDAPSDDEIPIAPDWPGIWEPEEPAADAALPGGDSSGAGGVEPGPAGHRAALAVRRYVGDMAGGTALRALATLRVLPADGQGWGTVEDRRVIMDEATRRELELTRSLSGRARASLLDVVDRTRTAMGSRLLRAWIESPLADASDIASRQEAVAHLVESASVRQAVRRALEPMADLQRLTARLASGALTPRELARLVTSLGQARTLEAILASLPPGPLRAFLPDLRVPADLDVRVGAYLVDDPPLSPHDGGIVRDGADAEIDGLRAMVGGGRDSLSDIEGREREATGLPWRLGYHRKLGYFLELARSRHGPGEIPERFRLIQGMAAAARYTTPELTDRSQEMAEAADRLEGAEYALFMTLLDEVKEEIPALRALARATAEIDARQALAETAQREGWVRPEILPGTGLALRGSRHPVVEAALPPGTFVPNDVELGGTTDLYLVTGPNMGGKSTYLRQVALSAILAQIGSFVPADWARTGPVDRIFARIGAGDDLVGGRSTFLVEMEETAAILRSATRKSLVVIDELGRGTATFDGLALAWAVIEHLATRVHSLTLVATHYHELIELAERLERTGNLSVQAVEAGGEVRFLRRVVPGGADRSYGIAVARLAGLPGPVLRRAEELLGELEASKHPLPEQDRGPRPTQMQLVPAPDARWAREVLGLDLGRTSPLDALVFLTGLQERLRREGRLS